MTPEEEDAHHRERVRQLKADFWGGLVLGLTLTLFIYILLLS